MDLQEVTPRVVRFGVFELDRRSGELRKDGVRVRLQEQPLRVLDALLAEPGEPVTREALRQRLWPDDTFVDFDSGLNRAINRLRAALGDEADNPRFIETLERRGYRFIAPVGVVDPPAPAGRPSAPATTPRREPGHLRALWLAGGVAAAALAVLIALAPALRRRANPADHAPIRSLAVLPLANLTGDPAQEYFSDGMTDALITNFASLPALRVISRQSVMRYKGSAKPLPEIAHAPTDRHLRAHSYECRLEDVLALQGELSRAIAEEVRITVGTEASRRLAPERPVNPDAYDAYLLGRHHWNHRTEQSLDRALEYFQAAIAQDPDFALAHAGLGLAYAPRLALGYVPPGRGLSEQKTAALRALELDPLNTAVNRGVARDLASTGREEAAPAQWNGVLELDPDNALSHLGLALFHLERGRTGAGSRHLERARALEPDDPSTLANLAKDPLLIPIQVWDIQGFSTSPKSARPPCAPIRDSAIWYGGWASSRGHPHLTRDEEGPT